MTVQEVAGTRLRIEKARNNMLLASTNNRKQIRLMRDSNIKGACSKLLKNEVHIQGCILKLQERLIFIDQSNRNVEMARVNQLTAETIVAFTAEMQVTLKRLNVDTAMDVVLDHQEISAEVKQMEEVMNHAADAVDVGGDEEDDSDLEARLEEMGLDGDYDDDGATTLGAKAGTAAASPVSPQPQQPRPPPPSAPPTAAAGAAASRKDVLLRRLEHA